jgi:hypothetical protein
MFTPGNTTNKKSDIKPQELKGKKIQDIMLSRGRSMSSVSHGMRPSVELTIHTFDPAFGIGKLFIEIVHLLLALSFALTELQ